MHEPVNVYIPLLQIHCLVSPIADSHLKTAASNGLCSSRARALNTLSKHVPLGQAAEEWTFEGPIHANSTSLMKLQDTNKPRDAYGLQTAVLRIYFVVIILNLLSRI